MKINKIECGIERLKSILDYDPLTGLLRWKTSLGNSKKGNIAGHKCNREKDRRYGYIHIGVDRRIYAAHRLAWAIYYGEDAASLIDHKNKIRDDNRIDNLRLADESTNTWNSKNKKNKVHSKYKGVTKDLSGFRRKPWRVVIRKAGKDYRASYATEIEAAHGYDRFSIELFKDFGTLNFPHLKEQYLKDNIDNPIIEDDLLPNKSEPKSDDKLYPFDVAINPNWQF